MRDTELMRFAHEYIRAFRGQEPPYDALEVEFLVFCFHRCAAAERDRTIEAVTDVANSLPADASEAFYLGYKLAIRNALAAIRADTPPPPPEGA